MQQLLLLTETKSKLLTPGFTTLTTTLTCFSKRLITTTSPSCSRFCSSSRLSGFQEAKSTSTSSHQDSPTITETNPQIPGTMQRSPQRRTMQSNKKHKTASETQFKSNSRRTILKTHEACSVKEISCRRLRFLFLQPYHVIFARATSTYQEPTKAAGNDKVSPKTTNTKPLHLSHQTRRPIRSSQHPHHVTPGQPTNTQSNPISQSCQSSHASLASCPSTCM